MGILLITSKAKSIIASLHIKEDFGNYSGPRLRMHAAYCSVDQACAILTQLPDITRLSVAFSVLLHSMEGGMVLYE
ncbi:hypothetical protein KDH_69610 [Dictyobacter sp. S3.2.2.5]|uniref:Uncharacterized protein n=1 Tax=Dictyobacter halimunensis TaxID=3026934 RepID=A0ABQ6G225_9CHLR|nr:hypothetical protein KDH_69610 [Dictyobacter sp. S3.2.2.5]